MKIKKGFICLVIPCLMFVGTMGSVNAATPDQEGIQPRRPICNSSYTYESTSSSSSYKFDQQGEFKNATSQSQKKSISYSTTYSSSVSTNAQADLNLIASKLSVGVQVSAGVSKTVKLTTTFTIAPYSIGKYKVGQKSMTTKGYIVSVYEDCSSSRKYVTSNFSVGPYDEISMTKL